MGIGVDDGTPLATANLPTFLRFACAATSVCGTESVAEVRGRWNRESVSVALIAVGFIPSPVRQGQTMARTYGSRLAESPEGERRSSQKRCHRDEVPQESHGLQAA